MRGSSYHEANGGKCRDRWCCRGSWPITARTVRRIRMARSPTDCAISRTLQVHGRRGFVDGLEFLQTPNIRVPLLESREKQRQSALNVIDVEGDVFRAFRNPTGRLIQSGRKLRSPRSMTAFMFDAGDCQNSSSQTRFPLPVRV
jgi:hypothetical protein